MPGCAERRRRRARLPAGRLLAAAALLLSPAAAQAQRSSYEELQTFSRVLGYIRLNHADSVGYDALVRAAIDGMLRSLDPHSRYVTRAETEKRAALARGELGDIGVSLEDVDGATTVLAVAADGPAARAGVLPGDRFVALDDTVTAGMDAGAVEAWLIGPRGSRVRVSLERGPRLEPDTLTLRVERAEPRRRSVSAVRMASSQVGYIRLEDFGETAAKEVRSGVERLLDDRALAILLDLRGNPGGLVREAVDLASLFLPERRVVFETRGRKADVNTRFVTEDDGPFRALPLMLLVDEGSASASEALAGALQDHDRALLLGRRTFGKALVQTAFPVTSDAVVSLTIGHVVTPSGRLVQRRYRGLGAEQYRALAGSAGAEQDTAAVFRTMAGRTVRGGGGIRPDIELPPPPSLPGWWSAAAEGGLEEAVADSAAHTLPADGPAREAWLHDPDAWRRDLLAPYLDRVRDRLGVRAEPDAATAGRIARRLAARAALVRWGEEARAALLLGSDADVRAALASVGRIPDLLR